MADCTHGMPNPASCMDCMLDGNIEPVRVAPEKVDRTFRAAYPGTCPLCDDPIEPDTLIAKTTRERYVHNACAASL